MSNALSAVGMTAPCIIQPLTPAGSGWRRLPPVAKWITFGYPAIAFFHESGLCVISAVEVAEDKDQIKRGAEYHISISKETPNGQKLRCDSNEANLVLSQFKLAGAIEDNHVPGGFVRNFWRPVAEPLVGMECVCKEDEPAIREDKGDFVWRPA
jgi:hypothetical protein